VKYALQHKKEPQRKTTFVARALRLTEILK
jgi:hypothetical protein